MKENVRMDTVEKCQCSFGPFDAKWVDVDINQDVYRIALPPKPLELTYRQIEPIEPPSAVKDKMCYATYRRSYENRQKLVYQPK